MCLYWNQRYQAEWIKHEMKLVNKTAEIEKKEKSMICLMLIFTVQQDSVRPVEYTTELKHNARRHAHLWTNKS